MEKKLALACSRELPSIPVCNQATCSASGEKTPNRALKRTRCMRFDNRTSSMARRGARAIYFTRLAAEELCIVPVYPKAEKDNIP